MPTQPRRPPGIPTGGQFAPTNRPEATGLELIDDDLVDEATTGGAHDAPPPRTLTADSGIARLDEAGRRLAEHLGYDYAPIDAVDEHHGLTTTRSTLGFVTHDGGKHFFPVGTSATGHGVLPFGPEVFTPGALEAEITAACGASDAPPPPSAGADAVVAQGSSAGTSTRPQRYRQATGVREGSRSPWGRVDYVSHRAVGISDVGTAGHGGVKLSGERNREVHEAWRRPGGWYEEDCEWAIVAMTFPECYSPEHAATARTTARNWFPDEYEAVTGETIQPIESYVRDEQVFFAEHADDWVTTAALAADPGTVHRIVRDDGVTGGLRLVRGEQPMVKVWARVGGRRATGRETGSFLVRKAEYETRAFLVPKAEYETRGRFGLVIDPDKYEEVAP